MFPKGLGGLGDLANMVKHAMEMKGKIEEIKAKLGDEVVEGSAGGGMVKITMNGRMEVLAVHIDPEVISKEEAEMLETLVRAGVNDAVAKAQALVKTKMQEMAGGMDIPGLTS